MLSLYSNFWSRCCLPIFGRYFVLTAVWLVIATLALVIIDRSRANLQSSDSTSNMATDLLSNEMAHDLEATLIQESKHAVFSFTTRCFDQMHQYSVVFIILSSGFWQYFVQGLMSQLALGPMLSSQYQINLFWIQQCHLTIGASHSSPFNSFFNCRHRLSGRPWHVLFDPCGFLPSAALGELSQSGLTTSQSETTFQVVWFVVGLQTLCSVFLCVVASSNVSSESWHPLPLVLIVALVGSTAHGVLTTCKQSLLTYSLIDA
jgi:hypothetical protein